MLAARAGMDIPQALPRPEMPLPALDARAGRKSSPAISPVRPSAASSPVLSF